MPNQTVTVVPAYGRDYKTKAEVKEAFHKPHDFKVQDIGSPWNGKAVGKGEAESMGLVLRIRYNGLQDVVLSNEL